MARLNFNHSNMVDSSRIPKFLVNAKKSVPDGQKMPKFPRGIRSEEEPLHSGIPPYFIFQNPYFLVRFD